jgi:hypothetical protein
MAGHPERDEGKEFDDIRSAEKALDTLGMRTGKSWNGLKKDGTIAISELLQGRREHSLPIISRACVSTSSTRQIFD